MENLANSSSRSVCLKDLSKRFRHSLSDPNYVCSFSSASLSSSCGGGCSLLELRGLARRFGLKFNALRGRAVYLSTEAFYLEVKDNGEARLHVLSPESIEVLPRGEDLLGHLKGLMELRPRDWVELSRLQDELKNLIGDNLIPRVGGNPAQITFSSEYPPLEVRPKDDHFVLQLKEPFPLAEELLPQLEKASGECSSLGTTGSGEYLLSLIAKDSTLNITLPDQRHRYYLSPHNKGLLLNSIPFSSPSQIPEILRLLSTQANYNTLINSCGSSTKDNAAASSEEPPFAVFEISSLSLSHISVSFEHPDTEGIHALEISGLGRPLRTKIYSSGSNTFNGGELLEAVLERTMSIPMLMRLMLRTPMEHLCGGGGSTAGASHEIKTEFDCNGGGSNTSSSNGGGLPSSGSSSFQVVSDPLNAKGPQEVVCIPGAKNAAAGSSSRPPNQSSKKASPSHSNPPTSSTKRKLLSNEEPLKPCVSITPVLSSASATEIHPGGTKIGIEIIPLGGGSGNSSGGGSGGSNSKYSGKSSGSSSSSVSSGARDIKRSLSEDDKRVKGGKKDKKRRHPSPLAGGDSSSSSKARSSSSNSSGSSAAKKMKTSSPDSLKVTLKSKGSPVSSPKYSGGSTNSSNKSPSAPKYSNSSSSSNSSNSSSSSSNSSSSKKTKERSAQEEEEVKRLLGGGKLLNKTFQIPKLSSSNAPEIVSSSSSNNAMSGGGDSSSKKGAGGGGCGSSIPSLMSLQPSIYSGKECPSTSPRRFSPSSGSSGGSSSKSPSGRRGSPSSKSLIGDVVIEHIS